MNLPRISAVTINGAAAPSPASPATTAASTACTSGAASSPMAQRLMGMNEQTRVLLERLSTSSLGALDSLCESLNMTLDELSEWIAHPANRRRIFNLLALADAQAQMLISQHRATAALQMVRLACDPNSPRETARRACKDLLNACVVTSDANRRKTVNDLKPMRLPLPPEGLPVRPQVPGMTSDEIIELMRRM